MQDIIRAHQRTQQSQPLAQASLDDWLHAVAFVMLRRQMRGRWMTGMGSTHSTAN